MSLLLVEEVEHLLEEVGSISLLGTTISQFVWVELLENFVSNWVCGDDGEFSLFARTLRRSWIQLLHDDHIYKGCQKKCINVNTALNVFLRGQDEIFLFKILFIYI